MKSSKFLEKTKRIVEKKFMKCDSLPDNLIVETEGKKESMQIHVLLPDKTGNRTALSTLELSGAYYTKIQLDCSIKEATEKYVNVLTDKTKKAYGQIIRNQDLSTDIAFKKDLSSNQALNDPPPYGLEALEDTMELTGEEEETELTEEEF